MFRRSEDQDAKEFWAGLEEELGETILIYALAQYTESARIRNPLWGLIFLTQEAIYFKHFPQDSWLEGLIKRTTKKKSPADEEFTIRIPREEVEELYRHPPKPWWRRLFSTTAPGFELKHSRGGTINELSFIIETNADALLQALRANGWG